MAATYRVFAQDIVFAANKTMVCVFNGTGTGVTIKPYRVFVYNNQTTAVSGVLTNLELRKITAASGGTSIAAVAHVSNNAALSANVVIGTNQTVTPTDLYRRVIWSTDEPAGTNIAITLDEIETFHPLVCIWSQGYADTTIDPITLNANEGIAVINTGAIVGQCDLLIEFTAA